jgi:pimeloyl-ACP methyl ester carboxylesterase
MIWAEGEGTGSRTVLLLHGLGATAGVWSGVRGALSARTDLRWIAADLGGHGRSPWQAAYSVGSFAAQLAPCVGGSGALYVVGHSLGAYVGLALASGWFGVEVRGVLGIGPKITWSNAELQAACDLAARPVRRYETAEEAWTRYRRVAGLGADIAPDPEFLSAGVTEEEDGWRLAQDPRTFAVAGAPFGSLAASAAARVVLARGAHDPMVCLDELQQHAKRACEISGVGHNAHVEAPGAVIALLDALMADG